LGVNHAVASGSTGSSVKSMNSKRAISRPSGAVSTQRRTSAVATSTAMQYFTGAA
jgi:hypothetical protein